MFKLNFVFALLATIFLLMASCTHKEDYVEPTSPQSDSACDPNIVYFVNDIQPLLNTSCSNIGCHDVITHADGVILTTYDKVMSTGEVKPGNPSGSELYEKIQEDKMPPSSPLSSSNKQLIYDWIKQGAKNNKCSSPCETNNVLYSKHIKPTIDSYCAYCHSGSSAGGGILITNYTELKAIAADGSLVGTIEHKNGFSPMPKGSAKLSDCKIKQINIWILDGMQNN